MQLLAFAERDADEGASGATKVANEVGDERVSAAGG